MAITVQNIYYLLCYAWDRLEERNLVAVRSVPGGRVENLLGVALRDAVGRLIRRGLDRDYRAFEEDTRRPRGKILMSQTARRMLLPRGRVACQVDELTHDTPHNRVIKAAIAALVELPTLDHRLRNALLDHRRRLHQVADVNLMPSAFRHLQHHRNVASYGFVVNLCRLVAASFLPEPGSGGRRFHPFTADEREMGHLFQAFVRNFLRREQEVFEVSAPKVLWNVSPGPSSAWLPEMQTDVVLRNAASRIVIEAKYYATPYQSRFGSRKLISAHLYQVLTYLSQMAGTPGPEPIGVLLYAGRLEEERLSYRVGGRTLLVRSIDLSREWPEVHRQVLALAEELEAA
jgi:5-methylcytosine-specific restriction enzyme subunit McrC